MDQRDIEKKIGEAWKSSHKGQDATAIEGFLSLVEQSPDNVDAHWGLGLAYRRSNQPQKALDVFERVHELLAMHLESEGGQRGRYYMLNRMVEQQVEQLKSQLAQ